MERYNTDIRHDLEQCLEHLEDSEGSPLLIKLYIISRKDKAIPIITICCVSHETRKAAKASVRNSGVLDRCPGFRLASYACPLELSSDSNSSFDMERGIKGLHIPKAEESGLQIPQVDTYGTPEPRIGRRLEFTIPSEAGSCVQSSTGGLILKIGGDLYQITAIRATEGMEKSGWASKQFSDAEECELNSQSESDDRGDEQVGIVEGSLSPGGDPAHDEMTEDHEQRPPDPVDSKLAPTSRKAPIHFTLIKLSELEIPEASNMFDGQGQGQGHLPRMMEALEVAQVGMEPVSVFVVTHRGPISGTILPDLASLKLPGSLHFQTVHTVSLSEPIERGDHGSAVVDAATGACYGHVILGVEGRSVAYMVPAPDTVADIVLDFGQLPSLQLGPCFETELSDAIKRWKCVDPRSDTDCRPLDPLEKCTSCSAGKLYSARSRATAHLRRNHFPELLPIEEDDERRKESGRGEGLQVAELKKWISEATVTPLYARVMQAESDSESDYENEVDDTDDERERALPSPVTTMDTTDRQASLAEDNNELRCRNERLKDDIEILEGDIDVLMEDREELKQELKNLRRRLLEQESSLATAQSGSFSSDGDELTKETAVSDDSALTKGRCIIHSLGLSAQTETIGHRGRALSLLRAIVPRVTRRRPHLAKNDQTPGSSCQSLRDQCSEKDIE
ncbi:hypothetical protein diail_7771 [Diaporthe ilicicola]|nr:hypothetical protein diail_7771 [Diaporthe ilicicola]